MKTEGKGNTKKRENHEAQLVDYLLFLHRESQFVTQKKKTFMFSPAFNVNDISFVIKCLTIR